MAQKSSIKPWHEVVQLRDDLRTGELPLAIFAADLYDVVMQKGGRPVYERPKDFFALTYPTLNLRELVKDVATRRNGHWTDELSNPSMCCLAGRFLRLCPIPAKRNKL